MVIAILPGQIGQAVDQTLSQPQDLRVRKMLSRVISTLYDLSQ